MSKPPPLENLPNDDKFVDEALHAQAFKTTIPLKTSRQAKNKRASGDYFDKPKTTCMLYLQAGHLFYGKMGRSQEACIEVMMRHVQRVNIIYEPAYFNTSDIVYQLNKNRAKQSLSPSTINIDFRAHNRMFRLRLVHSVDSIFSDDIAFENTAGQIEFKTDKVYSGTMEGKDRVGL